MAGLPAHLTEGIPTADMSYEKRLFVFTQGAGKREPYFAAFRGLHRLNIVRLQMELAQLSKEVNEAQELPKAKNEELTRLLHAYSKDITGTMNSDQPRAKLEICC